MLFTFLQTSTEVIEGTVAPVQETMSLIDMAIKGGWLMIVLALLSVIGLYIFGERWWAIRRAGKISKTFMKDINDYILDGKIKSALGLCKKTSSPIARLVEKGIERIDKPLTDIQAAVENVGNFEVAKLEKSLPFLATIAGGAPMIGFLGTVMGMIQAFFNMSQAGNNIDISLLSDGIYTAMVTTVGGLIVGIMAYFGYNYLTARISDVVFKMENITIDLLDTLQSKQEDSNLY